MIRKFEENKKYKFSKDMFIVYAEENMRLSPFVHPRYNPWINDVDNIEVEVLGESTGMIGKKRISPMWCIEI